MITYEYECGCCGHRFEIKQSIKDNPLKKCNACGQHMLERLMFGGIGAFIQQEATTVGQLASRNTKKMGKYELQEKRQYQKEQERDAKIRLKQEAAAKLGGSIPDIPEERPTPVYGKVDYEKINKMNAEQKKKYILEGK